MSLDQVRTYYGETLSTTADLRTDACCTIGDTPAYIRAAMANIHPEVSSRYYGCGLIVPEDIQGMRILDLGCGAGRDVYLLAGLVGETGYVHGVDATPAQLAVATQHADYHAERFGYNKPNTGFTLGEIENLGATGLKDESFDIIVSNCVINLCTDKESVLREAHRLLKPGGELYFSDVYADRRLDPELMKDPVLHGECLAGALYWNDFLSFAKAAGFADPRLVEDRPLGIQDAGIQAKLGAAQFFSATYRLFKLDGLEPACEDYGQAVIYKGTVPDHPDSFPLDGHHNIETGRVFPVCGNTFRMLNETRLAPHFTFIGDFSKHFGIFPGCGTNLPFATGTQNPAAGASCC